MNNMPTRTWVEINLDNIIDNLKEIRKYLGEKIKINAVIKADGYGHGAVMSAKVLSEHGIDMLSVATLDEAIQLRKQKITSPIMVLGYTDVGRLKEIIKNNITVAVFDYGLAYKLSEEAKEKNKKINVHLKIDTGMNRIGFSHEDKELIFKAYELKGLNICGIFTHFSVADEKVDYTKIQFERFIDIVEKIKNKGYDVGICHVNNSGGTIIHKDKVLDMVRTGILLYGL